MPRIIVDKPRSIEIAKTCIPGDSLALQYQNKQIAFRSRLREMLIQANLQFLQGGYLDPKLERNLFALWNNPEFNLLYFVGFHWLAPIATVVLFADCEPEFVRGKGFTTVKDPSVEIWESALKNAHTSGMSGEKVEKLKLKIDKLRKNRDLQTVTPHMSETYARTKGNFVIRLLEDAERKRGVNMVNPFLGIRFYEQIPLVLYAKNFAVGDFVIDKGSVPLGLVLNDSHNPTVQKEVLKFMHRISVLRSHFASHLEDFEDPFSETPDNPETNFTVSKKLQQEMKDRFAIWMDNRETVNGVNRKTVHPIDFLMSNLRRLPESLALELLNVAKEKGFDFKSHRGPFGIALLERFVSYTDPVNPLFRVFEFFLQVGLRLQTPQFHTGFKERNGGTLDDIEYNLFARRIAVVDRRLQEIYQHYQVN